MWAWVFAATVASAQTTGIESNPNYIAYNKAVEATGSTYTSSKGPILQIAPGTIGFVDPLSGASLGGSLAAINTLVSGQFIETFVLYDTLALTDMNTFGFVLGHEGLLDSNNQAGMNTYLSELNDEDLDALPATYTAGQMTTKSLTVPTLPPDPNTGQLNDADPNFELYTFQLTQNGVVVGWLAREHFFYAGGVQGFRDHWLYKANYILVDVGGADVVATPWIAYPTYAAFLNGAVPNGPVKYQKTNIYYYYPLDTVVSP